MIYKTGDRHGAANLLGLKPQTVRTYHKYWTEGIHFYRNPPRTPRAGFTYNLTLIEHWLLCGRDTNHHAHIQKILEFQQTLSPKKRKLMAV